MQHIFSWNSKNVPTFIFWNPCLNIPLGHILMTSCDLTVNFAPIYGTENFGDQISLVEDALYLTVSAHRADATNITDWYVDRRDIIKVQTHLVWYATLVQWSFAKDIQLVHFMSGHSNMKFRHMRYLYGLLWVDTIPIYQYIPAKCSEEFASSSLREH